MPRMGDLAATDVYGFSDLGIPVGAPEPPVDPLQGLPTWARQAAVRPESYEPQVGSWPAYKPPKVLPDVGQPLVGGGEFSPGVPAVNRAADVAGQLAYDFTVPSGPLDVGMTLATGPGRTAYKVAAGAIGALAEPSDAEAKLVKYPFNRIAVGDTPENLAKLNRLVPTKAIEEQVIQPHDIPVGSWLTPLIGDRSASGKLLTHVGEKELYSPVWMQGGYEFMPEWQKQNVVWGSDKSPSSAIAGRVKRMQAEGPGDVYGVYTSMTPFSVDASHHMSDTISQLLRDPKGRITKDISETAAEKFDAKMRAVDPEFPGVKAKFLQSYLRDKSMSFRDFFTKTMNSREAREAGFPDVEQARIAVTHPELMNTPTYSGGQSIGKMTGDVEHGSQGFGLAPHYTYRSKLRGEYTGGMPALPQEVLWPDFSAKVAQRDPSAVGKIWLTGLKGEHMGQQVTSQWQDTAAEYLRRNPAGATLAGAGGAAVMGALAAPSEAEAGPLDVIRKGIKAYHGSPHDFERFDLSRIGTGEGAQAYGHGLYFAENPEVARSYRSINAPPGQGAGSAKLANDALQMAHDTGLTGDAAVKFAQEYLTNQAPRVNTLTPQHYYDAVNNFEALTTGKGAHGKMYEVNINADPAHFLDWDKPLREQSQAARDAARKIGMLRDEYTGSEVYKTAAMNKRPEGATAAFSEAGIPGIKYLDQGSRGAGTGSSNYVVFDDKLIDILKKYGLAGLPAGAAGMGALAAQDRYAE